MRGSLLVVLLLCCGLCAAQTVTLPDLQATWHGATVVSLRDAAGNVWAASGTPEDNVAALTRTDGKLTPQAEADAAPAQLPLERAFTSFAEKGEGSLALRLSRDTASSDLIVEADALSTPGLGGAQWGISGIPLDCNIIIPGRSGIRLTRTSPGASMSLTYPHDWEAQFVIVERAGGGFWVWAEDTVGRYKALKVWRRGGHWSLAFETQPNAPFEDKTEVRSVRWHLGTYRGDWTVPATRYRQWAAQSFRLTPLERQRPAWVADIRALFICGMEEGILEAIARSCDPKQTILYVPDWRRDGYDRNYPDYTPKAGLKEFLDRAHALGFRVMLHVNYFGCDPKNPEYERFAPFHARNPVSKQLEWWIPPRQRKQPEVEPTIKFAYINPAAKAWRELFVGRMRQLCTDYPVDSLHLDQTLCIYNDANGIIDGMTMLEGNLALHKELRKALPDVALSGEGLNEVTFRDEAFAQRHAWGVNHSEGTWDRRLLECAHPVSSFLMRPYTIINGYLGMCSPVADQYYAAWRQAYANWGVIPTFARPSGSALAEPTGFARQLLDELRFFQTTRCDPDLSGPWSADLMFPYKTADGRRAEYVRDGGVTLRVEGDEKVISQTVTGVTQIRGAGTIPGWRAYDDDRIFGLRPDAWYPYLPGEGRDPKAFHVTSLPEGLTLTRVVETPQMAALTVDDPQRLLCWIGEALSSGRTGYRAFVGSSYEQDGPLESSPVGASIAATAKDVIALHPPWKAERKDPATGITTASGTGQVYGVVTVDLPPARAVWFRSEVCVDPGAVGKTDGVTFRVEASAEGKTLAAQVNTAQDDPVPLDVELTAFAGKRVRLEVSADPGPKRSATFDWARWKGARVEVDRRAEEEVRIVSPTAWRSALGADGAVDVQSLGGDAYALRTLLPGSLYLTQATPQVATVPCDLTRMPYAVSFVSFGGAQLLNPQYAGMDPGGAQVNEVSRTGFRAHPPNQGQTCGDFVLKLPKEPVVLRAEVGLRDGSQSSGCVFLVQVNGEEVARQRVVPGDWKPLDADLSRWSGQSVVLSLVTDSDGGYDYDWAMWGTPRLEGK
jgi:hypothetical protein